MHSTADQRFDPKWQADLAQLFQNSGVAAFVIGGGTDLATDESNNEYEITGHKAALEKAFDALRADKYSFVARTFYGEEVANSDG